MSQQEYRDILEKRNTDRLIRCVDSFAVAMVNAHGGPSILKHLDKPFKEVLLELAANNIHFKYVGEGGKDD